MLKVFNSLSPLFFTPYILQPTRLHYYTLIDNIFFNSLEYLSNSGNLLIEISDHLIQFLILEGFVTETALPEINLFKRDFRNSNEREFHDEVVNKINWDQICDLDKNNSNNSCNNFFNTFFYHLDEFAPYRKVTKKEYKLMLKPWISKEILNKCKQRDILLKRISKEEDANIKILLRNEYKKVRNEITKDKWDNKKVHFTEYFDKNKHKASEIWKGIRSLVNIKSSKVSKIKLLDKNDNLISHPKKIANTFNDHFSTIGSNNEQRIPHAPGNFKDYFSKKDSNGKLLLNPPNSFFLSPTVPAEVEKLIDALNIKKIYWTLQYTCLYP